MVLIFNNDLFAALSPDKEDCFSQGIMSWIITGLIAFALISCVCCVVAYHLRNKVRKSIRFCTTLLH